MKWFKKEKQQDPSKTGYPVKLMPIEGESVRMWTTRFRDKFAFDPSILDFEAHGMFPCVKVIPESGVSAVPTLLGALEAADQALETEHWYSTDLLFWFTNDDYAVMFKLTWGR